MPEFGLLLLVQILALIVVNSAVPFLLVRMYQQLKIPTPELAEKLGVAFKMTLGVVGLTSVILLDGGIYYWVIKGDFIRSILHVLVFASCTLPFLFIFSFLGILSQLRNRDLLQDIMDSIAQRELDTPSQPKD